MLLSKAEKSNKETTEENSDLSLLIIRPYKNHSKTPTSHFPFHFISFSLSLCLSLSLSLSLSISHFVSSFHTRVENYMDNQCSPLLSSWAYYCQGKSMDDLRHSLLYATVELEQTRAAAQEELRKRDEQLSHLKDLLNNAIREKEEVQEKCQRLFLEKLLLQQQHQQQQQQHNHTAPLSGISSIEDEPRRGGIDSNNGGGFSSSDCEESIVSSPVIDTIPPTQLLLPSSLQNQIGELVPDKPLPEKGKLLQAVRNAGPLLQTLLLAGPLPQWRHPPPPLESFEIPPVTITSPAIPLPKPLLIHQDSLISVNGCNRKRVLCEGSDSPNSETKYQRVVHH